MSTDERPLLRVSDVVRLGGWHADHARVVALGAAGRYAVAVVDGNGDGREAEVELYVWDGARWRPEGSFGTGAALVGAGSFGLRGVEVRFRWDAAGEREASGDDARAGGMVIAVEPPEEG